MTPALWAIVERAAYPVALVAAGVAVWVFGMLVWHVMLDEEER